MDLFRRKQKLIFWIVTIIIVPSFVLVWGVGSLFDSRASNQIYTVGRVNGGDFTYPEFESFRKRILAAVGGMPLQVTGAPGAGTQLEEMWKYTFAYDILKDAEKAGCTASDLQVGTYLRNHHPIIMNADVNDAASLERAVDEFCRQMQMTRREFLQGVREWQTIGNYIGSDANITAVNDQTIYTFYSLYNAECVTRSVRVLPTDAMTEQAKTEVMDKPEDELKQEAAAFVQARPDDYRYRDAAAWRFAWVFLPFVPQSEIRAPSEDEIDTYYRENISQFAGQTLDQVREQIATTLTNQEMERQTLRNFNIDVDPQLRRYGDLPLDDLSKLPQLATYGARTGDTGPTPVPAAEIATKLPEGATYQLRFILETVEAARDRDEYLATWQGRFNLDMRPIRVNDGYVRLRLLEFIPSKPMEVFGEDGVIKPDVYELALEDMVAERVAAMVREKALATEADIRALLAARKEGGEAPNPEMAQEFDALPLETRPYVQIADENYELGTLVVGDMLGPIPYTDPQTGARGQELVVMMERRVPAAETFAASDETNRNQYTYLSRLQYQGSFGFTYAENGPTAIIQPSPAMLAGIADKFNRGELSVNQEWLTNTGDEG